MKVRTHSVALTAKTHSEAAAHLIRGDHQEDLCFALWYPSQGRGRMSALIHRLVLPRDGDRRVHGNASFLPAYFERAIHEAVQARAGLAFMHSHPAPGWQSMSSDDIRAEEGHAAAAMGATGLPLVGLTLGTDGSWSARFWEKVAPRTYERRWCTHVRVVGKRFSVTYADQLNPRPRQKEEQCRTVSSWGDDAQADLARLRVGVVGAGSVGSLIAEALARTGVAHIKLIDFDSVERVNLDRLLHGTSDDAAHPRSKVSVLGKALRLSATADNFVVDEIEYSVAEEEGFRAALDCDVLFSCVDRPWARSVLNFIAYAHLIPVADGGIQVEVTRKRTLKRADWKAHVATPERRCLECLEQYDPGLVSAEREGYFEDLNYIKGLPANHPARRNENVFGFSLGAASLQMLQMLMMVIAPMGVSDAGEQMYHFVPGIFDQPKFRTCKDGCPYPGLMAKGDSTGLVVTARHKLAERMRAPRDELRPRGWRSRLAHLVRKIKNHGLQT